MTYDNRYQHLAVRGIQPGDPRVLYACGDSLTYDGWRPFDTTDRGARAMSHTFERVSVRCDACEKARALDARAGR